MGRNQNKHHSQAKQTNVLISFSVYARSSDLILPKPVTKLEPIFNIIVSLLILLFIVFQFDFTFDLDI